MKTRTVHFPPCETIISKQKYLTKKEKQRHTSILMQQLPSSQVWEPTSLKCAGKVELNQDGKVVLKRPKSQSIK